MEVDKLNLSMCGVPVVILCFGATLGPLGCCFPTAQRVVSKLERSERDQPILPFFSPAVAVVATTETAAAVAAAIAVVVVVVVTAIELSVCIFVFLSGCVFSFLACPAHDLFLDFVFISRVFCSTSGDVTEVTGSGRRRTTCAARRAVVERPRFARCGCLPAVDRGWSRPRFLCRVFFGSPLSGSAPRPIPRRTSRSRNQTRTRLLCPSTGAHS